MESEGRESSRMSKYRHRRGERHDVVCVVHNFGFFDEFVPSKYYVKSNATRIFLPAAAMSLTQVTLRLDCNWKVAETLQAVFLTPLGWVEDFFEY